MNKMMLSIGLVLFSQVAVGMDGQGQTARLAHKDQLYFLTNEDTPAAFKVDFVQRGEIKNAYPVCEVRVENVSNENSDVKIITTVGSGYLSFYPNSNRESNTRAVVNAIKQQCERFQGNARMKLIALNDFYFDMVIDIDNSEIENLIASIEQK